MGLSTVVVGLTLPKGLIILLLLPKKFIFSFLPQIEKLKFQKKKETKVLK